MKYLYNCLWVIALLMISCSSEMPFAPDDDLIVIRAYLYADEPVYDIQLTQTLELGSTDSVATPINDAEVVLVKNDVRYALTPSSGDSGYYHYDGDDLQVCIGDVFRIEADYEQQHTYAETRVPHPPTGIQLSNTQVEISSFEPGELGTGFHPNRMDDSTTVITVTWDADDDALFFVTVDCLEEEPVSINANTFFKMGQMRRFISSPTHRNQYMISRQNVEFYGGHRVSVYRVNQEYADLYLSRTQDSRDLNEPLTNVHNGLGIFSAFSSQSTVFSVTSTQN